MERLLFFRADRNRWWFFLVAMAGTAVIATVVGVAAAWYLLAQTEGLSRQVAVQDIRSRVESKIAVDLSAESLAAPLSGADYERLDRKVRESLLGSTVLDIKVWNREATVVYSTSRKQIGMEDPSNEGVLQALRGEELSRVAGKSGSSPLLEVYIPVTQGMNPVPEAVVEVHQDYTPYDQALASLRWDVAVTMFLLFLTLPLGLYTLYRVGWAQFSRERAQAAQRLVEVKALNSLLQQDLGRTLELQEKVSDLQRILSHGPLMPSDRRCAAHFAEIEKRAQALADQAEQLIEARSISGVHEKSREMEPLYTKNGNGSHPTSSADGPLFASSNGH